MFKNLHEACQAFLRLRLKSAIEENDFVPAHFYFGYSNQKGKINLSLKKCRLC